jgi:hypothetical protein
VIGFYLQYKERILEYKKNKDQRSELSLRYGFSVPWSKLIKKEFLLENNIKFDEVIASNDVMFSTKVGYHMEDFTVSKETIYCTTRNKGSLTVNLSERVYNARLRVYINRYNYLNERLPKEKLKYFSMTGQGFLFKVIKNKLGIKKFIDTYKKLRRNNIPLFETKLFNPVYLYNKLLDHYKRDKKLNDYYTND